jgi:hypothetical protein
MNIFDNTPRRKRDHDRRQYTSPKLHDIFINGLLPYVKKPLGMRYIRAKLYSLPLSKLHSLHTTYNTGIWSTHAFQAGDYTWERQGK